MKSRQVAIVTPTARERFSAARPMLLLIAVTVIALIGSAFLSQMGYNNAPVGIRNKHGDGARALAQVLGDHGVSPSPRRSRLGRTLSTSDLRKNTIRRLPTSAACARSATGTAHMS